MLTGLVGASISIVLFGIALTNTFMSILLLGCLLSPRSFMAHNWATVPVGIWLGFFLFLWVLTSATWSVGTSENIAEAIRKYREFLLLPLMFAAVRTLPRICWAYHAMYVSLFVAILVSFALWLSWVEIPGAALSIKNRIFFGISTSVFFYWSLVQGVQSSAWKRWAYFLAALLGLFGLLFIETGRTGYVLSVILFAWFLFTQFRGGVTRIVGLSLASLLLFGAYLVDDGLKSRVDLSIGNTAAYFEDGQPSSIGYRLEFYRNALVSWKNSPWIGNGSGSYPTTVESVANPDRPWGISDNPHQQYLLFLSEGGLVGLLLFLSFLLMLGYLALKTNNRLAQGVVIAMSVSCLFNSSFLDSGDSHFYWLMLLIVGLGVRRTQTG